MKRFNTKGLCIPSKHYMVDITDRLTEMKRRIDDGQYFVISRGRQYGKTTTLNALAGLLSEQYIILSLDFQNIDNDVFRTGGTFVQALARLLQDLHEFSGVEIPEEYLTAFEQLNERDSDNVKMDEFFRIIRRWCMKSVKPIVLMIDEVDSASNNQVFLDFLAQMRALYLKWKSDSQMVTFQSVVLAGVTDVRHLRSKIRDEDQHKVNSPWNIADVFEMDMNLSREGIQGMLEEYEKDHATGMDIGGMAGMIHDQTGGYPFLVSRLCQLIDEKVCGPEGFFAGCLSEGWTRTGLDEALKLILAERNTLFESLSGKILNHQEIKLALRDILMEGKRVPYNADNDEIAQLEMYGFIRNSHNTVAIANRIFETRLYNYFCSEEEIGENAFSKAGDLDRNMFVSPDGQLNMRLVMERFITTYTDVFGPLQDRFQEKDGRELFLLYLRPIINGTGNYYIEAQTRDQTRTDVVVDYRGQQYVIELKIWRGPRYNAEGERQLQEYLDYFRLDVGYMLSFNFNKKKETGVKLVKVGEKTLYEGML